MSAYPDALDELAERLLSMCVRCCGAILSAQRDCERQQIRAAHRVMATRIDFAEFSCAVAGGGVD